MLSSDLCMDIQFRLLFIWFCVWICRHLLLPCLYYNPILWVFHQFPLSSLRNHDMGLWRPFFIFIFIYLFILCILVCDLDTIWVLFSTSKRIAKQLWMFWKNKLMGLRRRLQSNNRLLWNNLVGLVAGLCSYYCFTSFCNSCQEIFHQ